MTERRTLADAAAVLVRRGISSLGPVRALRDDRDRHAAHAVELEEVLARVPSVAPVPDWFGQHLPAALGLASRDSGAQVTRLADLALLAGDLPWDAEPEPGLTEWGSTPRADAALLSAHLRERRPARIVVVRTDDADGWTPSATVDVTRRWDWGPEIVELLVGPVLPAVPSALHQRLGGADLVAALVELVRAGDALLLGRSEEADAALPLLSVAATIIPLLPAAVLVQVPVPHDLILPTGEGPERWLLPGRLTGQARQDAVATFQELAAGPASTGWLITGHTLPSPGGGSAQEASSGGPTARATRLIEWTGERCVPWTDDYQVVYEHIHRYLLAAAVLAAAGGPRSVLDLASGEGYGSAILASNGHVVTGVDIAPDAVEHARLTYQHLSALDFTVGSMLSLEAFATGSVGAVTCFEALEHVVEQDTLLSGISRVLSDDGLLFISSPDRDVYTHSLGQENPFHLRELDRDELDDLLGRYFPHVRTWGQTVMVGSMMADLAVETDGALEGSSLVQAITPDVPTAPNDWAVTSVPRATYLLAVASRSPLPPQPDLSLLVDSELTLVRQTMRERDRARAGLS